MASVSNLVLAIDVANNGANLEATLKVDYDLLFSDLDQHSNQPYSESVVAFGDDTGIVPAEDGVDDAIPGGQIFPALIIPAPPLPPIPLPFISLIASDGRTSVHRHFTKTLPLSALNEDQGAVPNPDEIRVRVTLTPQFPVTIVRESNQVALNI